MRVVLTLAGAVALIALAALTAPAAAQTATYEVVKDGIPKPLTATPGAAAAPSVVAAAAPAVVAARVVVVVVAVCDRRR